MSFFEKHRRLWIVAVITVLLFVIMGVSVLPFKNSFFVTNIINTIFSPVQTVTSKISDGVGGFVNYLFEIKNVKNENDRLTREVAELKHNYRSAEDYKAENERLKEILDIKEKNPLAKDSVVCEIIGWSNDNWYSYYTVNKGTAQGIQNKDIVICPSGLVGQVCEVGLNWARISTIIETSSSVGARIVRSGDVAIISGDYELERRGLCKMTFINKDAQIIAGDTVETSGLGENYPGNIALGKVVQIVSDSAGVSQYAIVEPYADLKNLKQVIVLKR